MKKVLALSLLVLAACAPKSESLYIFEELPVVDQTYQGESDGRKKILTVYTEESQYHVLGIEKVAGKIQDIKFRKRFANQKDAEKFISDYVRRQGLQEVTLDKAEPKFITDIAADVVWPTKNQWTWEWELKFAEWFKAEVNADFFKKYNVWVDCADVAYALRWIFSRIHFLPAAAHLAGSKELITNESVKANWKDLPTNANWYEDKKFLAALNFMLENTYTHTLKLETYPIAINKEALIRSTVFLFISGTTGHTQNLVKVEEDGISVPMQVLASSVPRQLTVAVTTFFYSTQPNNKDIIGFIRFRWPVKDGTGWRLLEAEKMPHYSQEQYAPEFMKGENNFTVAVLKRIFPNFDLRKLLQGGINNLKEAFNRRFDAVVTGHEFCKNNDCAPGTDGWENWSTPSRDKQIRETIRDLTKFSHEMANQIIAPTGKEENPWDVWVKSWEEPIITYKGEGITLKELAFLWTVAAYNSDPREKIENRWGIEINSLLANIGSKATRLLNHRLERIKENTCGGSCAYGSEAWNESQTYLVDSELQYLEYNMSRYCQHASSLRCQEYQKQKEEFKITLESGISQSLGQWLKDFFWLNSDPRWPEELRWGGLKEKWNHSYFNPGLATYRTKEKLLVRALSKEQAVIEDLGSSKIIPWESGYELTDYNVATRKAIGRKKHKLFIYDLNTGGKIFFERDTQFAQNPKWVTDTLVFVPFSMMNFELFDISQGTAEFVGKFEFKGFFDTRFFNINLPPEQSKGVFVFQEQAPRRFWPIVEDGENTYSVLDLNKPRAARVKYQLGAELGKHLSNHLIHWATEKYFIGEVSVFKCLEPGCGVDKVIYLKIDRESGKTQALPDEVFELPAPFFAVKDSTGISICRDNSELKCINEVMVFEKATAANHLRDNYFEVRQGSMPGTLLRFNADKTISRFGSKHFPGFVTVEDLVITVNSGDGLMRIEDFSGNELRKMKRILPTRSRDSNAFFSVAYFFAHPAKAPVYQAGLFVLDNKEGMPLITGMGLFFSVAQSFFRSELPVFLGINFEEIHQVFETGGYRSHLDKAPEYSRLWSHEGFTLYRNRDEAIWFSPVISQ